MSLTLATVLTAARDRSRAFFQPNAPDAVLARYLSDVQNELIAKAVTRDRQYLAQTAVVSIAIDSGSAPGTFGAGTGSGVPGTTDGETFQTSESTTGSLVEAGVTVADGAMVLFAESVVSSATSATLTHTSAGRTVNADIGRVVVITAGKGYGQRRAVVSNTADTWTISTGSDGLQWAIVPDATSLFAVVAPVYVSDDTAGAVTALPSVSSSQGYLVKLDASGTPFIDYSQPLTATVEAGVPLPSLQALLPELCQVWRTGCAEPEPLRVTTADQRFGVYGGFARRAVYTIGQALYLTGTSEDWSDVASLELRYVPVAPTFTALTDVFLLPDHAKPVLVAKAAAFMALRVQGIAGATCDPEPHLAAAARAESDFLRMVLVGTRGRGGRVRAAW